MRSQVSEIDIKVLLIQEDDGRWSAQCLNYDIAAQARSFSELQYELEKTFIAYAVLSEAAGEELFANLGPAPQEYWDMWERSDISVSVGKERFQTDPDKRRPIPRPHLKVAESAAA